MNTYIYNAKNHRLFSMNLIHTDFFFFDGHPYGNTKDFATNRAADFTFLRRSGSCALYDLGPLFSRPVRLGMWLVADILPCHGGQRV